jgi:hypothetical protein
MSQRWMCSVATVATSSSSRPAPSRNSFASWRRSPAARFCQASAISIAPHWIAAMPAASSMCGGLMIFTSRP